MFFGKLKKLIFLTMNIDEVGGGVHLGGGVVGLGRGEGLGGGGEGGAVLDRCGRLEHGVFA